MTGLLFVAAVAHLLVAGAGIALFRRFRKEQYASGNGDEAPQRAGAGERRGIVAGRLRRRKRQRDARPAPPASDRKEAGLVSGDGATLRHIPKLSVSSTTTVNAIRPSYEHQSILVATGDDALAERLAAHLGVSFQITTAADGEAAYDCLHRRVPDLVVAELALRLGDGRSFVQALRSDPEHEQRPLIVIADDASEAAQVDALDAGAADYVTRPFSALELEARIANLLVLRRQERHLRALNDELKQANDELWRTNEMKSKLLGMAAHDLRSPLSSILSTADVLIEEAGPDGEVRQLVDWIRTAARDMDALITELLESVALDGGRIALDKERRDLGDLAARVVESYRHQAAHKQQSMTLHVVRGARCHVEVDARRMREAMGNLVSNAIKYSEPGQPIVVSVRRQEGHAVFTVQDVGQGISEEEQQQLFEPFRRLSARPTAGEASSGLGLYITHELVSLHGGRLGVQSAVGEGSTFSISLPLASTDV